MVAKISSAVKFVKKDIWSMSLKTLPRSKSFLIRQLRIVILAIRGYAEDDCKFRASALTFFSLLSIVPFLAVMFGIAKGFGLKDRVEALIKARLEGQEEIAGNLIEFSNSLLEGAKGGVIAGIGIFFVFWSIIKVLGNIENSFNQIWGIKRGRHIGRKFSDYLSLMLVCPILLVVSSSVNVMISKEVTELTQEMAIFQMIGPVLIFSLKLLPYITIWLAFTFLFVFMPNTKVKLTSGLIGGIVAGTLFQIFQLVYFKFQVKVVNYNEVYGSFAAIPLFLIWLQVSWLVILFGAELSFAHQNVDTYEFEQDCLGVSYSYKKLMSLLTVQQIVANFCKGGKPWDANEISHRLEIPIRLIRQILFELVECKVLTQAKIDEGKDAAYLPGTEVEKLTLNYVVNALEESGNKGIPVVKSKELEKLTSCLTTFAHAVQGSGANILLKDIAVS